MRDDTKIDALPLSLATRKALKDSRPAALHPNGFRTLADLRYYWEKKGQRRGFLNLKDITFPMLDEIARLLTSKE